EACSVPKAPADTAPGTDVQVAIDNHKLMAPLLAQAMACDQTRVVNMSFTDGASSLRRPGETVTHHIVTHEEPIDEKLGYQAKVNWFDEQIITGFATWLAALDSIKEGD